MSYDIFIWFDDDRWIDKVHKMQSFIDIILDLLSISFVSISFFLLSRIALTYKIEGCMTQPT